MNNQRFEQRMAVRPLRNNEVWYRARLRNIAKAARASVEPELRKFIKSHVKPENKDMAHHLAMTARQLIHNAAQKYMSNTDSTGINIQSGRIASRAASINLDAVDRQFQKHLKQATGISAQFGKPDIAHGKIVSTVHVGTGDTRSTAAPSDWLTVDSNCITQDDPLRDIAWEGWKKTGDFDPDQPRDEGGKWTSGGGGAAAEKPTVTTGTVRIQAATAEQRSEYAKETGSRLHGFAFMGEHVMAIESLDTSGRSEWKEPKYQVLAPEGFHFAGEGTHALLCQTLAEVRSIVGGEGLAEDKQGQDFDPDQPRDETGKWTDSGGGATSSEPDLPELGTVPYYPDAEKDRKYWTNELVTMNPKLFSSAMVPVDKVTGYEHGQDKKRVAQLAGQLRRGKPLPSITIVTPGLAGYDDNYQPNYVIQAGSTGGHHRLLAAKAAGIKYIGVEFQKLHAEDFDPDQPRDEGGRWTSGETSGYTGGGVSSGRQRVNPNDPRERQRAQADLAQSRGAAEAGAGSLPYTYTRRSGRDVEGVRVLGVPVRESWSLDPKTADELKAKGYASPDVHELDYNDPRAAQVFHDQIAQTKVGNRFAASVHVYSPEEYGQMRMFLSKDGKAGMALKPDGDMVSAFVHGDGPKGAIHTMLEVQKQAGGTKLDCFDTVLPAIYAPHGFTAVARTSWNDEYKPEGWDKNIYAKFNHGEPDVVFMARSASAAPYHAGDGVRVDYDKAVSIQQAAVNQFTKRGAMSDWLTVDWKQLSEEEIERQRIWQMVHDFDPDQPRDETGKWTTGGGASGAAPSGTGQLAAARAQGAISQAVKHANSGVSDKATYDALREQAYRPELEPESLHGVSAEQGRVGLDGKTTREIYQVNGKYTPARQEIHDKIVDKMLGPEREPEQNPVVIFQGGGAASGKTEAVGKQLEAKYPGIAVVDADVVKFGSKGRPGLPEGATFKKSDPLGAAARLHEESSDIVKQAVATAAARSQSLIIDSVGGSPDKMKRQIDDFRKRGYRVEVHYADRDTNHALAQMATRYQNSGRWVPPDVLVDGHQKAAAAYHKVAPLADEASLRFSKERTGALSETKYELVHRSGNGAHQYSVVENSGLYEQHRRKGRL